MWAVTDDFLESIAASGDISTTATVTLDGLATPLGVVSGSVGVQAGSNVRRQCSLEISGGDSVVDLYDILSSDGSVLRVRHGFSWGDTGELVPVFTGFLSNASVVFGEGTVKISGADFGADLAAQTISPPVTQLASMFRTDAIEDLVTDVFPGITVHNLASDNGTLGSSQTWMGSRWDAINSIATDARVECFFYPDGSFVIRDLPELGEPVWSTMTGPGGTILSGERQRPLDRMWNTVIVNPAATDGSQGWTTVSAQIADPAHPRFPGRFGIGVRPIIIDSSTAATSAEALAIATAKLRDVQGTTETISLGQLSNPALEVGDVLAITFAAWEDTPQQTVTHLIDSTSLDLATGAMTLDTRSGVDE